jgi:hypothetical protein
LSLDAQRNRCNAKYDCTGKCSKTDHPRVPFPRLRSIATSSAHTWERRHVRSARP